MLSAIAARKARLQGKAEGSAPPSSAPQGPPVSSSNSVGNVSSASKRKHSSSAAVTIAKKKQKKQARTVETKKTRYFEEQDATILLIDSGESSADSESESSSQSDRSLRSGARTKEHASGRSSSRKRTWSPSRVVVSSSEEVSEDEDIVPIPHIAPTQKRSVPQVPVRISTYEATQNQNLFQLSQDEAAILLGPSTQAYGASCALIMMSSHEQLALFGIFSLVLLRGRISMLGLTLTASQTPLTVFSTRSSPVPIIECLTSGEGPPIANGVPRRCSVAAASHDVTLLVRPLITGAEGLGSVCRTFENAFIPPKWGGAETLVEGIHLIRTQSDDLRPFVLPQSWEAALSSLPPPSMGPLGHDRQTYLVKGAKKSGKSTFSRTLLNRLLTRYQKVAFLECDIGQSEFTLGGMVSLNIVSDYVLGPPWSHPSVPFMAHYVGSTTPKNTPSHYIEAIHSLIHVYNIDIQYGDVTVADDSLDDARIADVIPLVVNTMGWTKGLGATLSKQLDEAIGPSHIFDFQAPSDEGRTMEHSYIDQTAVVTAGDAEENVPTYHSLEPIPSSNVPRQYSAVDYRNLSILSYFHAKFPPPKLSTNLCSTYAASWDTTLPLCAQHPYEVTANVKTLDLVVLIGPDAEDVVPSELHRVLNGAIVGLVSSEPGTLDIPPEIDSEAISSSSHGIPYIQGTTPPSPPTSTCHGLAFIRSVSISEDPTKDCVLHLLTPVPPAYLAAKNTRIFVKGELEIPIWGMLDHRETSSEGRVAGYEKDKVPFLKWGKGEGVGGERRRVRRNLMRKGQQ